MSDAAIIGAAWNEHLADQVDATLTVTVAIGTFDRVEREVFGATTLTVAVKCMPPAVDRTWDGTMRREAMQTLVGQLPAGTPEPRQRDILTIGAKSWAILRIQPLTDGETVFCWLLDLEAVGT